MERAQRRRQPESRVAHHSFAPSMGHASDQSTGAERGSGVDVLQREMGNRAVGSMLTGIPRIAQRDPELPPMGPPRPPAGANDPTGSPARLTDADEVSYQARGEKKIADLGAVSSTPAAGDTPRGRIAGFPPWFATLQDRLIDSAQWRKDQEEDGQLLLAEYATKRFAQFYKGDASKIPGTMKVYIQYIGRSTSNQKAAAAAGFKSTANVGGAAGAKLWCASAGSSSVKLALESVGLGFAIPYETWMNVPPGVPSVGLPAAGVDAAIRPGDQISYLHGGLGTGGHTVTALSESVGVGSVFEHVSGNAGGGTSGSVRLGSSHPRAKPPATLTWDDISTKSPDVLKAPADKMWVYVIVRYSQFWDELGAIDLTVANPWATGPGAAFLAKHKLKALAVHT